MGKGLEIDVNETVNKVSAQYFKSIHERLMPGFKNLPVKALNKGQGRIVPGWLSRKALPHPTLRGAHFCPCRCHSEMW